MKLPKFAAILVVCLVLIAMVSSCASKATPSAPAGLPRGSGSSPLATPAVPPPQAQAGSSSDIASVQQRLTVRTMSMTLLVDKVRDTVDRIAQLAERLEGFVISSQIHRDDEETATVVIRVPSQKTDEAVTALRGFATRVPDERQKTQDITEEFTDLQARLRNLQATEAKLLSLLNETKSVSETLQVQRELSNVREQVERLRGRIQYLERTSATSLITVTLQPAVAQKPLVQQGWNFLEIVKSSLRGLVVTLQVLGIIAIWIVLFLPIWGGGLAVAIYLRRRRRRKITKGLST